MLVHVALGFQVLSDQLKSEQYNYFKSIAAVPGNLIQIRCSFSLYGPQFSHGLLLHYRDVYMAHYHFIFILNVNQNNSIL